MEDKFKLYNEKEEEKTTETEADETEIVEETDEVEEQLKVINSAPGQKMYEQWMQEEIKKDEECMERLLSDKAVRASLSDRYKAMRPPINNSIHVIPNSVFTDFNKTDEEINAYSVLQGNMSSMWGE